MSDTPLTDSEVEAGTFDNKNHPHTDWVTAYFARTLERELAAAIQRRDESQKAITRIETIP